MQTEERRRSADGRERSLSWRSYAVRLVGGEFSILVQGRGLPAFRVRLVLADER